MTPRDLSPQVITTRLALMRELLDDLAAVGAPSPDDLREQRLTRRALERILTQLVDLAVSINQHVAATLGHTPAGDYHGSFEAVARLGVLTRVLAASLEPSVGMRNVLVHEYVRVDLDVVAAAVPLAAAGYGEYVRSVANWLRERDSR